MPDSQYTHLRFCLDSGYDLEFNSDPELNNNFAAFLQLNNEPLVQRLYPNKEIVSVANGTTGFLFGPTAFLGYGGVAIDFSGTSSLDRFYGDSTWTTSTDWSADAIGLGVLSPSTAFDAKFGLVARRITRHENMMSMSVNKFSVIAYPPDPLIIGGEDAAMNTADTGMLYEVWFRYVGTERWEDTILL
jgi:hypothetical protein